MANLAQIEQELRVYVESEKNLSREDRVKYLMAIFNKHFEIENTTHLINHRDFTDIISYAKSSFATKVMPLSISKKEIDSTEVSQMLLIESFIIFCRKHKVLSRFVRFDIELK